MPVNQQRKDTVMNRPTLTRVTGTPTARALAALPPTAKIQLPILVRCRIQADKQTNNNHHMTVIDSEMDPILNSCAKMKFSDWKPSIWLMFWVDTDPGTSFVTPRLAPCSTKNVPKVIRKLGMPVRITRKPLTKPMSRQKARERSAPTHRFIP